MRQSEIPQHQRALPQEPSRQFLLHSGDMEEILRQLRRSELVGKPLHRPGYVETAVLLNKTAVPDS